MTIRLATQEDLPKLYPLFDEFNHDIVTSYGVDFDVSIAEQSLAAILEKGEIFILEVDGEITGAMAGLITTLMFNKEQIFHSLYFYVKPLYRRLTKRFILGVEKMLRHDGIKRIAIGHPASNHGKQMDRFYKMSGYRQLEIKYIKDISHAK